MGITIGLYKYEWDKLIDNLLKMGIKDKTMLEEILFYCGEKENNSYYLLNNKAWGDSNCFYALFNIIDQYFNVNDSFDIFLKLGKHLDMSRNIYEIGEKFGIKLDE